MTIYKIKFKRTKESEWESGFSVDPNVEAPFVITKTGEVLYQIWDETKLEEDFCIDLTPILKD